MKVSCSVSSQSTGWADRRLKYVLPLKYCVILLLLCNLRCYWLNGLFLNIDNQAIKLFRRGTSNFLLIA